jgi:hypothetical protein
MHVRGMRSEIVPSEWVELKANPSFELAPRRQPVVGIYGDCRRPSTGGDRRDGLAPRDSLHDEGNGNSYHECFHQYSIQKKW